ncbi:MAG: hypothetical protein Q9159_004243 [Coniocarpon cinnabarinum]
MSPGREKQQRKSPKKQHVKWSSRIKSFARRVLHACDDCPPEDVFPPRQGPNEVFNQQKRFVHASTRHARTARYGTCQHSQSLSDTLVNTPTNSHSLASDAPIYRTCDGTARYFAPTSFRARTEALKFSPRYYDLDESAASASEGERQRACRFSAKPCHVELDASTSEVDFLGDPIANQTNARASLLTEDPLSDISVQDETFTLPEIDRFEPLQERYSGYEHALEQSYDSKQAHSESRNPGTKASPEHCIKKERAEYSANKELFPSYARTVRTTKCQTRKKSKYPPTSRDLSYTKRPAKHVILDRNGHRTIPSFALPSPLLAWTGVPVMVGRIPGMPKSSDDPSKYIRLMIDTGAEKTIIKKSSCPPNAKFFRVSPCQIGGLGGHLMVTEMALFKLIFAAKTKHTNRDIDVAVIVCADVIDDTKKEAPAMRNFDAIFGYPAILAHQANIMSGNHSVGSSVLSLEVTALDVHDPSKYVNSVSKEREARLAFELAPVAEGPEFPDTAGERWSTCEVDNPLLDEPRRTVFVPLATTTGYPRGGDVALEQWYG